MVNNKHLLGLLLATAAMYGAQSETNDGSISHGIPDNPKKVIPNGCKEYTFRGVTVIASSEKSAIKKINKRLSK